MTRLQVRFISVLCEPAPIVEPDRVHFHAEYIVEAVENSDESGYFEVARTNGKTASTAVKGLKMTSNYKFR